MQAGKLTEGKTMIVIDITNSNSINNQFKSYAASGFGADDLEVKTFAEMFWHELSEENRKLYRWVFIPEKHFAEDNGFEGKILERQEERYGLYE